MNRFFIFSALCTLLCFTFGFNAVHAEESKVDMTKCITLTVKQGEKIKLDFAASTAGVWVKVMGVKDEKEVEAPTDLRDEQLQYEAIGTEIKVYGAIDKFHTQSNKENLTALDVSQNIILTELYCRSNKLSCLDLTQNVNLTDLDCGGDHLSSIDLSKNTKLKKLFCHRNSLSSLDISENVNLMILDCWDNQLSSLDVSKNINLSELYCSANQLSSLDVSQNVNLTELWCHNNQLSSLDVTKNTQLENLVIYGNNFSTSTLNGIYCTLPARTGKEKGFVYLVNQKGDASDELLAKSTNKAITDGKNWAIEYWASRTDIEGIAGSYTCGSTYGLTLTPATIPNAFWYNGDEWKTMVTSTGNWKLDETTPLPDWLSVEPKQGSNGTQVTVTVKPNTGNEMRRAALTFVLTDDANTKQVVLLSQITKPSTFIRVTPSQEYKFSYAGETKENYFTAESSGAWTVTASNAEWLTIEPKSGNAGTTTITIKADANNNKSERSTELIFALKDNTDVKQMVIVKQAENPNAVEDVLFAGISVAPNPFVSQLKIKNEEAVNARYELVNTNGVVVRSGALQGVETVLNTEELITGAYLLRILSGSESKTLRVVKE